jgi:hypothetical protein
MVVQRRALRHHLVGEPDRWLRCLVRKAATRERGEARAEQREALGLRAGRAARARQRVDTVQVTAHQRPTVTAGGAQPMLGARDARHRVKVLVADRAAARPDPKLRELRSQKGIAQQPHVAPPRSSITSTMRTSRSSGIGPFVPTRERGPLTPGALARLPRPVADNSANRSNVSIIECRCRRRCHR